ncbi:MAG: hypothetical protein M1836_002013 [Candelina mexicana]|nr:MAG: hypothetical protein M1836_002013 [Candelina mexicana]
MASSSNSRENRGIAQQVAQSYRRFKEQQASLTERESLSDDLKAQVRADLKLTWQLRRLYDALDIVRRHWMTTNDPIIILGDHIDNKELKKAKKLCNKLTAFYWMQSAQIVLANGEKDIPRCVIYEAISGEWLRCHNNKPNIEFEHFFANPVKITSSGPSTVHGVCSAHLSLCTRVSRHMEEAKTRLHNNIPPLVDFRNYSLLPLYRALVVIIDRLDYGDEDADCGEREQDGYISLSKIARYQSVLLVRTGAEEQLSAPISFQDLKTHSLPLERPDITDKSIEVVRVSLAAAVQFVVNLEKREQAMIAKEDLLLDKSLRPYPPPKGFEKDHDRVCYDAGAWANAHILSAEQHGYYNDAEMRDSIRRVQAGLTGEELHIFRPQPYGGRWKW